MSWAMSPLAIKMHTGFLGRCYARYGSLESSALVKSRDIVSINQSKEFVP